MKKQDLEAHGLSSWSLRDWLVLEKRLEEDTLSRDEAACANVSNREEPGLCGEQQSKADHWGEKGREDSPAALLRRPTLPRDGSQGLAKGEGG